MIIAEFDDEPSNSSGALVSGQPHNSSFGSLEAGQCTGKVGEATAAQGGT